MPRDTKTKRKLDMVDIDIGGLPSHLKNLSNTEVDQLDNINTTAISDTQWGYVGAMDQGVATTDNPTFDGIEAGSGNINTTGDVAGNNVNVTIQVKMSILKLLERTSDPTQPTEGQCVMWMSDGTGKGDDGDVLIASTAGGVTNYATLFDHSAGAAW